MWYGLTEFQKQLLQNLGLPTPASDVYVLTGGCGIELERRIGGWQVTLARPSLLGRAAMLVCENDARPAGFKLKQIPRYERLGAMLDCSRNAVPKVDTVKKLLCCLSRMGFQVLQLYMEDVYQLSEYPYFGYGRGGYTKDQLKEIDHFAQSVGIELIPAIQTLAHLGQALKWKAMQHLVDVNDILLIDDEHTYALIDAMFSTMEECFNTHRINIGMDEAHLVGLGKYLDLHGAANRTELMLNHFQKVHEIANRHGFSPMLWSDMFFRLASGGDYYAKDIQIDSSVTVSIPQDTTLVYWDYYSSDLATYERMLEKHFELSPNVMFAGGAWKWSGFAPCNTFSMQLADLAHFACVNHGIKEVLLTMWSDNGAECSPFAVLPTLQYWAELCYEESAVPGALAKRFEICCEGSWASFMQLDHAVFTPNNPAPGRCAVNATKTLLYEDLLFPLLSSCMELDKYTVHFEACERLLEEAEASAGDWSYLFQMQRTLCHALAAKTQVRAQLNTAWQNKDKASLRTICDADLPTLRKALETFGQAFHVLWLRENNPAGLDIFDLRLGGLLQRVNTAAARIESYLRGEITTIEELDMEQLPFDVQEAQAGHVDIPAPFWHNIASPSCIATI
ncbi:beta-N-acetylhexosaminidase [Pygmaiobacter massiliensis]|uniref:beta-N-acetylhexosaminidase n=1 Tax=Pygmaiobacter massiliensis TaxID=1917873 RepID=UPI000C7B5F54|nr:beta-N-acetylhexosaminidase [Pygmaiobacter massiliensis]